VSGQALYPPSVSRSTRYIEPFLAAPMIRFYMRVGPIESGSRSGALEPRSLSALASIA